MKKGVTGLLKNSNALKSFTTAEIKQMRSVIKGGSAEDLYKVFGKLSPSSDDWFKGVMFSTLGAVGASMSGAPTSAVAAGLLTAFTVGRLAQSRAGQLFLENANLMRATLQAGNDAGAITRGYFSATPASLRKPQDLAILLLVNKANISSLANSPARSQSGFIKDVIFFTQLGQAAMDKESQEQPQQ